MWFSPRGDLSRLMINSYTWANEVCAGDNEERTLVIRTMNGMQYAVFSALVPIFSIPTPNFISTDQ
jgi:hypothetical protein